MSSIRPDIKIIRGDTSTVVLSIPGMDLTGATVFFTAKPALVDDPTDTTAVIEVEVTTHDNPTAGHTIILLSATDTDIPPGVYFYDIQVKKQNGDIISIPARKLEVFADVTRRTT